MLDVVNFVEGNLNYSNRDSLPTHITEQVQLRAYLCSDCLENRKCLVCKCKTPNMFYSSHKKDSKGRWAEFLSKSQWEALKNNYHEYCKFFDEQRGLSNSDNGAKESTDTSNSDTSTPQSEQSDTSGFDSTVQNEGVTH